MKANSVYFWLIAAFLLVPVALHAQEHAPKEPPSTTVEDRKTGAEDRQADTEKQDRPTEPSLPEREMPADSPVKTPTADVVPEERKSYPDCEFNNVPECDLAAQQGMAKSTWIIMWTALAGVALTLVGLFLLWRTLRYTRDAVEETKATTETARQQIQISEDTAKRQLRAYVNVAQTVIKMTEDNIIRVNITIKNGGQTPANQLHHWQEIQITNTPIFDTPDPNQDDIVNVADLGPGFPMNWPAETKTLDRAKWSSISNGNISVFVIGEVRYTDIFSDNHYTRYCFLYKPTKGILAAYNKGNESN